MSVESRCFHPLTRSSRTLWKALGGLSIAFAALGVIIPGLPATVFVLAALFCFARSSPQGLSSLLKNRRLGPHLRRFIRDGSLPMGAKLIAIGSMWFAILTGSLLFSSGLPALVPLSVVLGLIGTAGILSDAHAVVSMRSDSGPFIPCLDLLTDGGHDYSTGPPPGA